MSSALQSNHLFGDFSASGLEITWHDFSSPDPVPWSDLFGEDEIDICFNLSGSAMLRQGPAVAKLQPQSVAWFCSRGPDRLKSVRFACERHQFLLVRLSPDYLKRFLDPHRLMLVPGLAESLYGSGRRRAEPLAHQPMKAEDRLITSSLRHPPVDGPARALWYQSKVAEIAAVHFIQPPDEPQFFCVRQQRIQEDRVARVKRYLAERLDEALNLEELSKFVGCSQHYLCRTFSETVGMTISRYLRCVRIERAAQLLREGRMSVTEVAFEVGYNSMSHFSKAFREDKGVLPSKFRG